MRLIQKLMCLLMGLLFCAPLLLAQGEGIVDGRLINGTEPGKVPAGVTVEVLGLMGGMDVVKSAVTDVSGKFHMEGLPIQTPLLLRATYRFVPYYSTVKFDGARARVDMQVFEPTDSMQGIRMQGVQIAFKLTGAGLSSIESYVLDNETRPPRSYMTEDGNFRFSKAPGILEPPALAITAPGSTMPVTQAPLESADGKSYYSLYPLRPGTTTFEVSQSFPYQNGSYTFRKKFFHDVNSVKVGVIPKDIKVTGDGLSPVQTDAEKNFAVYTTGPVKAGTEVVWTFSGGTPLPEAPPAPPNPEEQPQSSVMAMPTIVGQNAFVIGALLLTGLVLIMWYAAARVIPAAAQERATARVRELRESREQLLNYVASLDAHYENSEGQDRRDYERRREQSKRHLRRIEMLLNSRQ